MALYCSACGHAAGDDDQFCAKCGKRLTPGNSAAENATARPAANAAYTPGAMEENIAAMLCYIPFIGWLPALVFLYTDPYRRNRRLRFHAWQSLFLFAAMVMVDIVLGIFSLGALTMFYSIRELFYLAVTGLFVVMMIKAYQRQTIRLPLVGDWAARQS